jgi:hypothetical protein
MFKTSECHVPSQIWSPVMSFSRRVAVPLSAAALSLLFAGTAMAATASSPAKITPKEALPSGCSWYGIEPATLIVHCGGLPANEEWQAGADCYNGETGEYVFKYGSIATGNSSSAITACYPRENIGFFPVS